MAEHELFPNNSERAREETSMATRGKPKRTTKLVPIESAKKTTWQKFAKLFLAEDIDDAGKYLRDDLIIPAAKDAFLNFMNFLLWGSRSTGSTYRDGTSKGNNRTNYNCISSRRNRENTRDDSRDSSPNGPSYREKRNEFLNNLIFHTKQEADELLADMEDEMADHSGQVSLGWLYDRLETTGDPQCETMGWTNLDDIQRVEPKRVVNGYQVKLPRMQWLR